MQRYAPAGYPCRNALDRRLRPRPSKRDSVVLYLTPWNSLHATDHERYAFDHFRRTVARQISLDTPRAKLTQLILHLSRESPVFRAIAALGSAHRGLAQITHVGFVRTVVQDQETTTQYSRAIRALHQYIGGSKPRRPLFLDPVLCACMLLASCEILENETATAISHLRFGRRILAEQSVERPGSKTASTLVSALKLLETDDTLFETASFERCASSVATAGHASWLDSLNITMTANLRLNDNRTAKRFILLQIRGLYSSFLLTTCRLTREVQNDIFQNDFRGLLDSVENYLSRNESDAYEPANKRIKSNIKPVILPALYLVALKCRDSVVRRRAIRLLASTDRLEGFQESHSLAA